MWNTFAETPVSGKRIVVLWGDGSGASLFFAHDGGFLDSEGDDAERISDTTGLWAYVPDDFEFWCENRPEDPVVIVTRDQRIGRTE